MLRLDERGGRHLKKQKALSSEPVWSDKLTGTGGPPEHPKAHCLPLHLLEARLQTRGVKSLRALGSNIKCFSTPALRKSNV